jgi:hypothetical protein
MNQTEFAAEWKRCEPWLEAALHHGGDTLTIKDVRTRVENGQYHFWRADDAAVITQVCPGTEEQELNILLGGGRMETLEDMLPAIENFALRINCNLVTVLGRLGWARSFLTKRAGYRPIAILLGKRLREKEG